MFGSIRIGMLMELKVAAILNQLDNFLREVAQRFFNGRESHNAWGFFLDLAFMVPRTAPMGLAKLIPVPILTRTESVSITVPERGTKR
jgi:hypothetical protein